MAVRNFYIDCDIYGRKTNLTGGPANSIGGMYAILTQRDHGEITTAFTFNCRVEGDELVTKVFDCNGKFVAERRTKR